MEVDTLRIFTSVAKLGSFAAAARLHGTDPSTVSRTISNLEEELGIRLFQRTTRSMTLTESGDAYLGRISTILEDIDIAREDAMAVSKRPTGTIRITTTYAYGQIRLLPLLTKFRDRFPGLKLDLILSDAPIDLVTDEIDIAIRLAPRIRGNVIASKIQDLRYHVYASPDYVDIHGPIDRPADLERHPCILFRLPAFGSIWMAQDKNGIEREIRIQGDLSISSILALKQGAINGLGPALLADWVVEDDIDAGRLIKLLPDYNFFAMHVQSAVWLVYPSRRYLPTKVRVVVDFLRENLTI
ncbi:MAG: LysR family transcriptional regulator [Rhizobiaceae bacterium MnEN-MB40S]|nr:MAG: LysR family transcriptional regulator [Rhizobiaceae bacterium MnEN-MB40S]